MLCSLRARTRQHCQHNAIVSDRYASSTRNPQRCLSPATRTISMSDSSTGSLVTMSRHINHALFTQRSRAQQRFQHNAISRTAVHPAHAIRCSAPLQLLALSQSETVALAQSAAMLLSSNLHHLGRLGLMFDAHRAPTIRRNGCLQLLALPQCTTVALDLS